MTAVQDLASFTDVTSSGVASDIVPLDALKSDTVDLTIPVRALRADVAGNVRVVTAKGNVRTLAFLGGETRYVAVTRVYATGTTATGIDGIV